jgi:hypothetical protein
MLISCGCKAFCAACEARTNLRLAEFEQEKPTTP